MVKLFGSWGTTSVQNFKVSFLKREIKMNVSELCGRCCCCLGIVLMMFGSFLVPVNAPVWGDLIAQPVPAKKCTDACGSNCGKWLLVQVANNPPEWKCYVQATSSNGTCTTSNVPGHSCEGCKPGCVRLLVFDPETGKTSLKCICDKF